jgi:hypothetical protein
MYSHAFGLFLGVVLAFTGTASPAAAQWENIETVDGAYGAEMTLTKRPHGVAEGLSVRAMAIARPDTTRWAISLIGAAPDASLSIKYGNEALSVQNVQRPDDGVGPTKVFVAEEAFLTMAETETVRLNVGNVTASLPDQLRQEMKEIFERVN